MRRNWRDWVFGAAAVLMLVLLIWEWRRQSQFWQPIDLGSGQWVKFKDCYFVCRGGVTLLKGYVLDKKTGRPVIVGITLRDEHGRRFALSASDAKTGKFLIVGEGEHRTFNITTIPIKVIRRGEPPKEGI